MHLKASSISPIKNKKLNDCCDIASCLRAKTWRYKNDNSFYFNLVYLNIVVYLSWKLIHNVTNWPNFFIGKFNCDPVFCCRRIGSFSLRRFSWIFINRESDAALFERKTVNNAWAVQLLFLNVFPFYFNYIVFHCIWK